MPYNNWHTSLEAVVLSGAQWRDVRTGIRAVVGLSEAVFTYQQDRATALTALDNIFNLECPAAEGTQFPANGFYLCEATPQVAHALSAIRQALNYKDWQSLPSRTEATPSAAPGAAGRPVVAREAGGRNAYGDAQQNYYYAVDELMKLFRDRNVIMNQGSFERVTGLNWA